MESGTQTKLALPLTPGLLISMSVRNDHSFSFDDTAFGFGGNNRMTLAQKQMYLISTSFTEYMDYVGGLAVQEQRREEIVGEGFYRPEKEQEYLNMAHPQAVALAQVLTAKIDPAGPSYETK